MMTSLWRDILRAWCAASLAVGFTGTAQAGDSQVGDGGTGAFYQWNEKIPTGAPRLLRISAFEPRLRLAEAAISDRILHSSRGGSDGRKPIIVSGGVYLPQGKAPAGGWPVIAWAHGTVGFPDICAPSVNGWSERDTHFLNNWLKQGYAVVASDYEGLGTDGPHPYLMSRSEATGVLDSVVAARKKYRLSRKVVIVGQSQGAHAAANAALMQAELAPSLQVKGVVLTGWTGSLVMPKLNMDSYDFWSVLYLRFLPTYNAIDPGFEPYSVLTPKGRNIYDGFRTSCGSEAMMAYFAEKPVTNTVFSHDPSPLEERAQPYRGFPPLAFKVPVFLGIGLKDEQTDPKSAFEGAKRACALGTNIAIYLYPGLGHSPTVPRSQEDSIPWVKAAFAGKVPPGNCADTRFPEG